MNNKDNELMEDILQKWNIHQVGCDWNSRKAFGNKICDMNCKNVFETVSHQREQQIKKELLEKIEEIEPYEDNVNKLWYPYDYLKTIINNTLNHD